MNKKNVVDPSQVPEIAAEGYHSAALVDVKEIANLNTLMKVSHELHKSGMFPQLHNAGQALAVILAGHEKGYGPMTSLMNIHIVKGRPGYSAQMIAAELAKAGVNFDVLETDAKHCKIRFSRLGKDPFIYEWTEEDAKRATKLPPKPDSVWATYPQDMMYARCLTGGARKYAPDAIMGVYLTDEISEISNDISESTTEVPKSLTDKIAKKAKGLSINITTPGKFSGDALVRKSEPEPLQDIKNYNPPSLIEQIQEYEADKLVSPFGPIREKQLGYIDLDIAFKENPEACHKYLDWLKEQ